MFVRDIEEGIADTAVKAAFLKCAIDHPGLTRGVERVMRAVAKAHLRPASRSPCTPTRVAGAGLDGAEGVRRRGRGPPPASWATAGTPPTPTT